MIQLMLMGIALVWSLIASWSDIKTTEVPDWISFSLLSLGIFSVIARSVLEYSFIPLLYALGSILFAFLVSLLLYYGRQWGGGDAKLLIALSIPFSQYPKEFLSLFSPNLDMPLVLILFINILLLGVIYSMAFSFILVIKNWFAFKTTFKKALRSTCKIRLALSVALIISFIPFYVTKFLWLILPVAILFVSLVGIYLFAYIRSMESSALMKTVAVGKLQEGDWILEDVKKEGKIIYSKKELGITKEKIEMLKHQGIKTVRVKYGVPFIPSFFFAVVVTLAYGNILTTMISMLI